MRNDHSNYRRTSREIRRKVSFGKLNVDKNRAVTMQLNNSIPTLIILSHGKLVNRITARFPSMF
jgi:thioredoxin-like negative regulator of GroEL